MQRECLERWLPGLTIEADMSWGLVATTVLRARSGDRRLVIKAGGPSDHHIVREIRAHCRWTRPWVAEGRAARLLYADDSAKVLVTDYLPGELVEGSPVEARLDVYTQAGELLRHFHGQASLADADYEVRMNAKAEAWLDGAHRIDPEAHARLRAMVAQWGPVAVTCVPTHGDWQGRNWLWDDGVLRVIDFGRAAMRPAAEDLERLAVREFVKVPGAERAFFDGYGTDPRDPEAWWRQQVRAAIGTACWAYRVGDETFELEGHRMIADLLRDR
ncbi:aminoglycoside phosphotransferase family protein [Ruania suaedae]|uniref:phosphotransferase n=1 Tax=Ruania suaedae TaxID=2897774 RepID=UPI001E535F22|nr:phosphotransferase [Ruania suaedae]UFU04696.1 aminoglycoside phosphotransferase family protein [Ruania suaedae]